MEPEKVQLLKLLYQGDWRDFWMEVTMEFLGRLLNLRNFRHFIPVLITRHLIPKISGPRQVIPITSNFLERL